MTDASPTPSPLARYRTALKQAHFVHDPAQERIVKALEALYRQLVAQAEQSFWQRLWARLRGARKPIKGLYIWGEVGRGKTWLMDSFYQSLPFESKTRLHFYHFMRAVHDELKTLRDKEDPLAIVAARWAQKARVICFDEFVVTDIADATLLGRLLQHLFARGVVLVATSNIEPDGLYRDGLKRELFLPAIALLKQHTRVIRCDDGDDYRLRHLSGATLYYHPADATADEALAAHFHALAGEADAAAHITIQGRNIPTRRVADGLIWFDFDAICTTSRAASDYIDIAHLFHTVIISAIPVLDRSREDAARRFIALVDEFYDRGVKLIISAATDIDSIYRGKRLEMAFTRTRSRLMEMQSHAYLARLHQA